jgi:arylsulfatase A-like enzyme
MDDSKVAFRLGRALNLGLMVAAAWLPFELARIGAHGGLAWVTLFVFWGLGVSVALVIEVEVYTARRLKLGSLSSAGVYALGSLLITIPLAARIFDGSFASTLPGASSAGYWLPLVAYLVLVVGLWPFVHRLARKSQASVWPQGLAALLVALAFVVEGTNRNLRTSEYPDLHAFGVCVVFIATYLALSLLGEVWARARGGESKIGAAGNRLAPWLWVPLLSTSLASSALLGLEEREDRLRLARDGQHSQWLIRALRRAIDLDSDGFSAVFGGADCDDFDASVNPDADEQAGNTVDENCDGFTSADEAGFGSMPRRESLAATPAGLESARDEARRWRERADVSSFVGALDRPHLILLSVDALRADLLREGEANREQFPEIFALLDESQRFRHAFAPAAGTDLSMSTLMTGHVDAFMPTEATLAERLEAAGWYTTSVVPSEVLRYAGKVLLMRGFMRTTRLVNDAQEKDVGLYSSSRRATQLALDDVDRYLATTREAERAGPLALWVHYFDVHEHDELSPFDRALRAETRSKDRVERYRASLALVDAALGDLRKGLEGRDIWDQAVVVLVSDHGESLGEDPRLPENHGRVLYAALTDVPLALRIPGVAPKSIDMPVSLVDVAPTLLSLLGVEPGTSLDGLDLLPELVPATVPRPQGWSALRARAIPLYESEQRGVISWPYKLLWRPEDRVYELFDLEADPKETRDLSESEDALRAQLAWLLSEQPRVELDRTPSGRRARERNAKSFGSR